MITGFLFLILAIFLFLMVVALPIVLWWGKITAQAWPRAPRGSRQQRAERRSAEIQARDTRVQAQGSTGD